MWLYFVVAVVFAAFMYRKFRSKLLIEAITKRSVFITGCDSGFGRLLAERLDEMVRKNGPVQLRLNNLFQGVHVYAGCLKQESVDGLQQQCSSKLKALKLDITEHDDVVRAVKFVKDDLNGRALWALVNNAGICLSLAPFEWMLKEDAEKVFSVNVFGAIDVTLNFLPLIKKGNEGRIVNVSSISGRVGFVGSSYTFSKYAVEGLSDALSFDLEPFNISVHVIEPGPYKTPIADSAKFEEDVNRRWKRLDFDTRNSYGDDFLKGKLNEIKGLDTFASDKIHQVPDAIIQALFAKFPKERYPVGNVASYLLIPVSFFPVWFQMRVWSKLNSFGGKRPIPCGSVKNR